MLDRLARVLLIEDDPADVHLVELGLTADLEEAFRLETVSTLEAGLRQLQRHETDVLLLDLFLPDSRGEETLNRVREAEPELPIVVLTGASDERMGSAALRGGADDYFVKGEITAASLRRSIRHARERQRIRRENRQLQERIAATQKVESLREMARGVTHDFNNLLTVILGNAAPSANEAPSDPATRRRLDAIAEAARVAAGLTRQLMLYAGGSGSRFELIDVSAHVRSIESLLRASVPRNVTLTLQLADELPGVQGDASQLHQLLINLVINAAEAVGDENGTVRVSTSVASLGEKELLGLAPGSQVEPGPFVRLAVEDSGCGMSPETLARAFDPFFSTKFSGRGLGLAVVQAAARAHQGGARVTSEPGVGSTVMVYLPASASGEEVARPEPTAAARATTGNCLVLLVDDDDGAREVARCVLEGYGYQVLEARSGRQALQLARDRIDEIALALIDLTMPDMDGAETVTALRAIRPDLKVILTSGYGVEEMARRTDSVARVAFLPKPSEPDELAALVQDVLENPGEPDPG